MQYDKIFQGVSLFGPAIITFICLLVGYYLKENSWTRDKIDKRDIPLILGFVGMVLFIFRFGFSIENIANGALVGFSSTGLYEVFKNHVKKMTEGNIFSEIKDNNGFKENYDVSDVTHDESNQNESTNEGEK